MSEVMTREASREPLGRRVRRVALRLPALRRREERIAELRAAQHQLREDDRRRRRQLATAREDAEHLRVELLRTRAEARREREEAEARLASARAEADERARAARTEPSFGAHLHTDRRLYEETKLAVLAGAALGHAPRQELMNKLRAYRFAESHGVAVPEVLSVWSDLDDIEWDSLPEAFVLKSAVGHSSHGVYPLRRALGGFRVLGDTRLRTPEDITTALRRNAGQGRVAGPYFAEALLEQRTEPGSLPMDHKLYAFYGEVGQVLLRRVVQHGNTRTAHWQYLDRDGVDLGDVATGRTVNPDLPAPPNLADFVAIAERLSAAVPTPMIRVDLYDTPKGVCLGEFTVMPGGRQDYRDDHDLAMGRLWDSAAGQLQRDLSNGRPFALTRGGHPVRTPHAPVGVGVGVGAPATR